MNILMVLTSHEVGRYWQKNGLLARRICRALLRFYRCGRQCDTCFSCWRAAPLDPSSDTEDTQTKDTKRFKEDSDAQKHLANTEKLADMNAEDFDSVLSRRSWSTMGLGS